MLPVQLLSESQRSDDGAITRDVDFAEIIQKLTTLTDQLEKPTTSSEIFCVGFEVFGERFDARCQ